AYRREFRIGALNPCPWSHLSRTGFGPGLIFLNRLRLTAVNGGGLARFLLPEQRILTGRSEFSRPAAVHPFWRTLWLHRERRYRKHVYDVCAAGTQLMIDSAAGRCDRT